MATFEDRQKIIEDVKRNLEGLAQIDALKLSRIEDLSRDINFSEAVPFIETLLDIIKQLNQRDISRLGYAQLTAINAACTRVSSLIDEVKDFNLNQNTPADVCKSIINKIKDVYDSIMEPLTLPLSYTATQATDYSKIEREAKGYHANMKELFSSFQKQIDSYLMEAEKAMQAVKAQAAEAGVSTNAHIFLTDSEKHAKIAIKWLKATIIISLITLLVAIGYLILSFMYKPDTTPTAIQYIAGKIILLSTLSFGIFWCARNYKSSKHNETLNKHRANALMTYRAFVEGGEDPQIKDAILLQAAQAAFVNRPTGYETQEKEPQTINPIIDVLGKSIPK